MSAKRLCAQLITRALQDLTEEEEEIVVDYLEDSGISVSLDSSPKELCVMLLEKTMEKELGRRVPMTAYANTLLGESTKKETKPKVNQVRERQSQRDRLQSKSRELPGCQVSPVQIPNTLYTIRVDPDLGIAALSSGESQYTALVSVPMSLYDQIFSAETSPVLEMTTNKGERAYARIGEPHSDAESVIYVSPLVGMMLGAGQSTGALVKLCSSLPTVNHIDFTFYGAQEQLDAMLEQLINTLPQVVEAFSYLSLGMVLNTKINGQQVEVRVDGLTDVDDRAIFAGLLPFGVSDIAFDISPDM